MCIISALALAGSAPAVAGSAPAATSPAPAKAGSDQEKGKAMQEAFFAGGCFWGVEYWFDKAPGVTLAESGYMGGSAQSPSYEQVCTGKTGHAETVRVLFDPSRTTFEAMARLFFEIHDPTQVNGQGPDIGPQYRSVVFHTSDEQKRIAEKLVAELEAKGFKVATRIEPKGTFWKAEEYHQDYYEHKGSEPYCHAPVNRFGR